MAKTKKGKKNEDVSTSSPVEREESDYQDRRTFRTDSGDKYSKQFHKSVSYHGTVREFDVRSKTGKSPGYRKIINVYAWNRRDYRDKDTRLPVSKGLIRDTPPSEAPSKKAWRDYTAWFGGERKAKETREAEGKAAEKKLLTKPKSQKARRGGRREARRKASRARVVRVLIPTPDSYLVRY